jgi:hypothetical protein
MLDAQFPDFLIELSEKPEFAIVRDAQSHVRLLGAYDQELVLRFFALKNFRDSFVHDVTDFLWEYMESVSDPATKSKFDIEAERINFTKTFAVFTASMGELAFGRANKLGSKVGRSFSIYHFESFAIGIQSRIDAIDLDNNTQIAMLRDLFTEIKLSPEFIDLTTGGGKNSKGPLRDRISFVQDRIEAKL